MDARHDVIAYVRDHPGPISPGEVAEKTGVNIATVRSVLSNWHKREPLVLRRGGPGRYDGWIYDGPNRRTQAEEGVLPGVGEVLMLRVAAHIGGDALVVDEDSPGSGRAYVLKIPSRLEYAN